MFATSLHYAPTFSMFSILAVIILLQDIAHEVNTVPLWFRRHTARRNADHTESKRQAVISGDNRWSSGVVPYEIGPGVPAELRTKILWAVQEFNSKTCVKWVQRSSEGKFVSFGFSKSADRCQCSAGPISGINKLTLNGDSLNKQSIILHEMMHCMGFLHEHAREDRDKYITINWKNIGIGFEEQYQLATQTHDTLRPCTLDLPYDYSSIMHYEKTMFTSRRKEKDYYYFTVMEPVPVMEARGDPGRSLGDSPTFTALDIKKISRYYCGDPTDIKSACLKDSKTQQKRIEDSTSAGREEIADKVRTTPVVEQSAPDVKMPPSLEEQLAAKEAEPEVNDQTSARISAEIKKEVDEPGNAPTEKEPSGSGETTTDAARTNESENSARLLL